MRRDPKIMTLTADMGFGVFEDIQKSFGNRFINTGVAEANTAGIAAGLALSGYTVFFYGQATFVTMRCFEQVRLDIASHNLNVKIIGTSAGFTLSQYGVSHHAIEDVALMRLLPNMTVLCPGDLYEAELATKLAHKIKGPVYIRIGRTNSGADTNVHPKKPALTLGFPILLKRGREVAIIANGSMLARASEVAFALEKRGVSASLVSMPTVKPVNERALLKCTEGAKIIFTLEEHTVIGGLGSAVIETMQDCKRHMPVIRLGIKDTFLHIVGSRDYLLAKNQLSVKEIVSRIIRDTKKYA